MCEITVVPAQITTVNRSATTLANQVTVVAAANPDRRYLAIVGNGNIRVNFDADPSANEGFLINNLQTMVWDSVVPTGEVRIWSGNSVVQTVVEGELAT
jgi:hypothetical protein